MTYRKHLITIAIGWLLMGAVAVLILGIDALVAVALIGGGLVLLSLVLAFALEHGGELIRKWRENGRE